MVTDTLEATAYQAIEVRRVRPDLEQPRKTFDEEALQELAGSLDSNGLLQPIVVRPDPEGNNGDYLLIAGERRWRAAGILGWDTIPALIRDDVTASEAAKLQLLENIVRRDLNPVEEARALRCLFISTDIPKLESYLAQLSQLEWNENVTGRIVIDKTPEGAPSPDLYDAGVCVGLKIGVADELGDCSCSKSSSLRTTKSKPMPI